MSWPASLVVLLYGSILLLAPRPARAADPPRALVVLKPAFGPPGTSVDVVGFGFDDGQRVEVRWDGVDGRPLGVGAGRDFTIPVVVPASEPGLHTVVVLSRTADGAVGTASSDGFLVTYADEASASLRKDGPGSGPGGTERLPGTSGTVWVVVVAGLAALATALAWARRRRLRRQPRESGSPTGRTQGTGGAELRDETE